MTHPVQSRCRPKEFCQICGASPNNHNQHDEHCLSTVPVALMPLWRRGFDAQTKAGYGGKVDVPEPLGHEADLAFAKGVATAAKKLSDERTIKSLEQAVEIARSLHP